MFFPLYVISTNVERSHTFALAKVNVSQIHTEIIFFISFRNTIACLQAIVEISPLRFAWLNSGRDDVFGGTSFLIAMT